ncbi:sensor histidine kinase [Aquibacillus halophilus]|uniref:Sensor histidine kinase n=1 Tax=Aquibacillus halophilus TaxID=930132 RepID=A0A6A8DHS6_9BACI|nr:sensor histidine kinase [Aquibacillus halophilus]MRH44056.1 sensor histidine kinase [Aquibacillus halophilus]
MNSVVNRSIFFGITLSLLFTIVVSSIFLTAFPVDSWLMLWEKKIFELPFIIVTPVSSLLLGATTGLIIGFYWRKQLMEMESAVETLTQGGSNKIDEKTLHVAEINDVFQQLKELEKYIHEQTKRNQKLISERVEDQEEQIEKVISEERNRLARELHDSVSQELFAASMMVSAINESNPNGNEVMIKQLKQVEVVIQQAQLEMRALLLHLRPIALKDKTLKEGIKQLLDELKQKVPIEITWKMEQVALSRGVEDHLFRILQESVSNTLRHSKAHSLDILLIERDNNVILRVIDDGVGFQLEKSQSSSYGLTNMRERAAEIGANLRIISVPNEGTRLEVRVPIIEAEGEEND